MMTPTVRAVLFDLDGTLIDHDSAAAAALVSALESTPGLGSFDQGEVRRRRRELEDLAMGRYLAGDLTFTAQRRLRATASSAVGSAKPDPGIFHHACGRLGLRPAEVVYVGDRLHSDAVAATRAGLRGVWLNRTSAPPSADVPTIRALIELWAGTEAT